MNVNALIDRIVLQFESKKPFACYALPEEHQLTAVFQADSNLYHVEEHVDSVFMMAPFKKDAPSVCIPRKHAEIEQTTFDFVSPTSEEIEIADSEKERVRHIDLVNRALQAIRQDHCKKIVVSRKKQVPLPTFNLAVLIQNLLSSYPDAFRYVWYHPTTGIWCGASPEVLLVSKNTTFKTMALAGTQKMTNGKLRTWTPKEVTEQNLVTQVMAQRLQKVTSVLRISKMYTHKAGALAHIRTDLEGVYKKSKFTAASLAAVLHPTPAVCGTPTKNAVDFIKQFEGYDRSFYTGYVGRINTQQDSSQLYVNLRCMHIQDQTAHLFVGGGITAESEAISEWEETQHKLQTMAKVIGPFL